jgi:hypothetical protein
MTMTQIFRDEIENLAVHFCKSRKLMTPLDKIDERMAMSAEEGL